MILPKFSKPVSIYKMRLLLEILWYILDVLPSACTKWWPLIMTYFQYTDPDYPTALYSPHF